MDNSIYEAGMGDAFNMGEVFFVTLMFGIVVAVVLYNIIAYAPGQKKELAKLRHTRSHHSKRNKQSYKRK